MPPLAYFGIESSGLSLVVDLVVLCAAVVWLALVYWAYADARRRIEDPAMVGLAGLVAFVFPFIGALVYTIVRPPEYLEDVRERELEVRAAEARLGEAGHVLCPYCDYRIEREFVRCPSCLRKLKERCVNCARPLDQAWTICPYCEADVPGLSGSRPRRRRAAAPLEPELPAIAGAEGEQTLAGADIAELAELPAEATLTAERRASDRRASERRAAAAARAAARASRPRPAP
jgi:hypothetical protein